MVLITICGRIVTYGIAYHYSSVDVNFYYLLLLFVIGHAAMTAVVDSLK